MAWSWVFHTLDGSTADVETRPFPAQGDAESWIGEEWPGLFERGVVAVTLVEDEREVYGPMSLLPPP